MTPQPVPITRSALRYRGGKGENNLAQWIIGHLPPHDLYAEPYGGAANILLRKRPATFEVYNDLYGEVVNFFRVLREREAELIRAIQLTPWALGEWALAREPTDDPLEAARRFYVQSWQSFGGASGEQWSTGWRRQTIPLEGRKALRRWNRVDHLHAVADRLKHVQIERRDALWVIRRYDRPGALLYVDPPYPAATRGKWSGAMYAHELSDDEHRELAGVLRGIEGMAVVSSYPCELYEELYGAWGWQRVEKRAHTDGGSERVEVLWLSPQAARILAEEQKRVKQLGLWE